MIEHYRRQVQLLVSVLPYIAAEGAFALKGGTAINLFYRAMPRLSVDIDLTYLPLTSREQALEDIDQVLNCIVANICKHMPRIHAQRIPGRGHHETRILLSNGSTRVKVETSPVARGVVNKPTKLNAAKPVVDMFGFVQVNAVSFEDLFAGKLHAALDRQHPRDLFDIKLLYENEGLTDELYRVLMVYLASSARPMHELLAPQRPLDKQLFEQEFVGMTTEPVRFSELVDVRARLHADIRSRVTEDIAQFLLSLHEAAPDFAAIGLAQAKALPAVRCKVMNLQKLKRTDPVKHRKQRDLLMHLLG